MAKKILVVDDEPSLVEMVANRLRAGHYEVVSSVDGKDGFEKAQREKPDLILLDILMPDRDGYQLLRQLKENEGTRDVPVIMLTVKKWDEDIHRAIDIGAVDYIIKPFDPKTLLEKIQKVLGHG